jgi:hypothetical protein
MQKILLKEQKVFEDEVFESATEILNHYKTLLENDSIIKLEDELFYSKNDLSNIIKFFIITDFFNGNINVTKYKVLYLGLSYFQSISTNKSKEALLNDIEMEKIRLKAEFNHFLKCLQNDFPILIEMKTGLTFPYIFMEKNYPVITKTLDKLIVNVGKEKEQNTSIPFKKIRF